MFRSNFQRFLQDIFHNHARQAGIFFALLFLLATVSQSGTAATIVVPAGGDLQAALVAAQPGDTIILQAGVAYVGNFTLPVKSGADFITIQSSRVGELPEGVRVSPSQSPLFAKLQSATNGDPVLETQAGAHHYKFIGIEFSTTNANVLVYELVRFGKAAAQTTLDSVPHHLVIDRCYIHGFATQDVQRGISLNSAETSVINSYISDIHGRGYDTQAICGWNGPGPYQIINNYLEGSGENLMFGGSNPSIPNLVPSDIEIRRNNFFKPLSWNPADPSFVPLPPLPGSSLTHWSVKNLLELKNARRVVIDGNVFENNWADAQAGIAILFTVRNDEGGAPWSIVEDITFTNNIVKNSPGAVNLLGKDNVHQTQRCTGMTIANNLFIGINTTFLTMSGYYQVTVDHNTHFQSGNIMTLHGEPSTGFTYRNNLTIRADGGYGVKGDSTGEGTVALETFTPGYIFARNVIVAANSQLYPLENFFPLQINDVVFTDYAGGNYRLATSSPYHNASTDSKDIGVDFDALSAALGGVSPGPTPSPTPTPTPPRFGQSLIRATRNGQDLSNQLGSPGGAAAPGGSSALAVAAPETEALQLFIAEIQTAFVQFNAERQNFPAAVRIEVELISALQSAQQAHLSSLAGDLPGVKTHLREAINHLELIGVLIAHPNVANPIDVASYVVRQHYVDFFDREPDQSGSEFWINQFSACGNDAQCFEDRRINVSAAFYLSIEFQRTGYFVHRLYKSSYGRVPSIVEFMPDNSVIGQGVVVGTAGWEARLEANKDQFLQDWVQRVDFNARYAALTNEQYVDALIANLGVTILPKERDALIRDLASGSSRASVLGKLAQNEVFSRSEFNSAFVLMQYFGYLRRDPDSAGFNFWLNKLNQFDGNYEQAEMVKSFLASTEYRTRFRL